MNMNDAVSAEQRDGKPDQSREAVRAVVREAIGVVFVAVTLFIPAGTLNWAMGWALVGMYAVWVGATALILIPNNPDLLIERATRKKGNKTWDTVLLSIVGLTTAAKYILAGLDVRWGWTPQALPVGQIPLALQIAALAIAALGYALGTWAMAANAFFSKVVRIQEDRGHAVATGGPYRYVRHPGYTGTIAFELATPIMLGSLWAFIPGVLAALLFVVRTVLEDKTLLGELDGYKEYAERVRYRLLPSIW
jgi:protein-S-isoprenylcysteine O-methyltransferase Ste14